MLKSNKGTYAAVKFDSATIERLLALQNELGLFNPVPPDKLHSTICYSRVHIPYMAWSSYMHLADFGTLEIWDTQNGKRALVLTYDSDYMQERHMYANILGATYDFPDYKPHVTLSYDLGIQSIETQKVAIGLRSKTEYVEDLDLDWKAN